MKLWWGGRRWFARTEIPEEQEKELPGIPPGLWCVAVPPKDYDWLVANGYAQGPGVSPTTLFGVRNMLR